MLNITINHGLTKSLTTDVAEGTTVRQIINNQGNKLALGYPESVSVVIDGVTANLDDTVSDGDTLVIEKQAAAKAA